MLGRMRYRTRRILGRVVMISASCWLFIALMDFIMKEKPLLNSSRPRDTKSNQHDQDQKRIEKKDLVVGPDTSTAHTVSHVTHAPGRNISIYTSIADSLPMHVPTSDPVLVCMVTYQRSGSSFLGEIFNQNPAAFEWFEPFDGLYSAMYGTEYGHNVPADIWNNWDGSARELPTYELDALARVAKDILTCNFEDIPTEVLLHHFVGMFINEHKRMEAYHKCTEKKALLNPASSTQTSCRRCNLRLARACGRRFGQNKTRQEECAHALIPSLFQGGQWQESLPAQFHHRRSLSADVRSKLDRYRSCMKPCREKALSCVHHLSSVCQSSSIRAIKPVRLPMEAAERVQNLLPQVKLIHNLRDPRAVVSSRKNTSLSFQAAYAGALLKPMNRKHDIIREAELFCRNVHSHVRLYQQMAQGWPDSLLQVIYEQYAQHPADTAQRVYDFLGSPLPTVVRVWLEENTNNMEKAHKQTTRNSTLTSSKWQQLMSDDKKMAINKVCSDLTAVMGNVWS